MSSIPHIGEVFALLTAIVWAFAVILFKKSGETAHPVALNLFKNVMGAVLLVPTIYLFNGMEAASSQPKDIWIMLLSGALGIGVADTLFFMCLNRLGAALSAIVDCLYSPMVIGLAMLWLGEVLSLWQIAGALLIIMAVFEATHIKHADHVARSRMWMGVLWGALAMAANAVGIVIVKPILETGSLLWVTEIRLLGGIAILLVMLALNRNRVPILKSLMIERGWGWVLSGSFTGAYLAMIVWLAGMKYTQASQAAALNQTSNVFVFVFAWIFLKERMTKQRVIGIGLAIIGVYLVTFG